MAIATTITLGGIVYNVYGETTNPLKDANDYFGGRIGATAWSDASGKTKQQAIISATRWMDRAVLWSGTKTVSSQPLQWPRDDAKCRDTVVPDNTVPNEFPTAEFELALILLDDAAKQDSEGQGSNIKQVKAGSAQVEFFQPTIGTDLDKRLPTVAWDLIGCYSDGATGVDLASATGTAETSSFDDCEQFELDQGYP